MEHSHFEPPPSPEILLTAPLTKWIELDFCEAATVFPNGMTFADADNDGMSEFVAGSIQGDLFIFKGLNTKCWKKASGLGMITVVGAGDIQRRKKNVVYVVTGEGFLYTFYLSSPHIAHVQREEAEHGKAKESGLRTRTIEPSFQQKIPPNIVMSVLSDIDGDGYPEVLFGMTDRVVRSFKWIESTNDPGKGAFVTLNKWEFAGQIANLSATLSDGIAQIFVSQPGGSCCRLKAKPLVQDPVLEINFEDPVYHNPAARRLRNPLTQAHVLGGVSFVDPQRKAKSLPCVTVLEGGKNIYAVCSFDGELVVSAGTAQHTRIRLVPVRVQGAVIVCDEDSVLWEHQTREHLISIQPIPLRDEFVIAASSGAVYVFDDRRKMLKYLLSEPINGFACGLYGTNSSSGQYQNSCAFATICSGGRVIIYYNLNIPCLASLPSFWRRPAKENVQ